jgi:hypothetical protein
MMSPDERRRGRGWLEIFAMYWGVAPVTDGERLQLRPAAKVPTQHLPMIKRDKAIIVTYLIGRRDELAAELEMMSPALESYERVQAFDNPTYQELLERFGEVLRDYQLFCQMAPESVPSTAAVPVA